MELTSRVTITDDAVKLAMHFQFAMDLADDLGRRGLKYEELRVRLYALLKQTYALDDLRTRPRAAKARP
jgi:hypothetical protein